MHSRSNLEQDATRCLPTRTTPCPPMETVSVLNNAPTRLFSTKHQEGNNVRNSNYNQVDWSGFSEEVQEVLGNVDGAICEEILPQVKQVCGCKDDREEPLVVLLGVSGGCDSMGLLHALLDVSSTDKTAESTPFFKRQFRNGQVFQLHVVHFDHRQRGSESDKDRQLVQDVCRKEEVPCHIYAWEDKDAAKFSQDKARKWRQSTMTQLLQELTLSEAESTRSGLILTAHHADDSQETLLLKLLRGVHIQNLSGMSQVQEMDDSTLWARPLLHLTKNQIKHYLTTQRYAWREDASNQSSKYLRNRVRNELIPLMQDLVGGDGALRVSYSNRIVHVRRWLTPS